MLNFFGKKSGKEKSEYDDVAIADERQIIREAIRGANKEQSDLVAKHDSKRRALN